MKNLITSLWIEIYLLWNCNYNPETFNVATKHSKRIYLKKMIGEIFYSGAAMEISLGQLASVCSGTSVCRCLQWSLWSDCRRSVCQCLLSISRVRSRQPIACWSRCSATLPFHSGDCVSTDSELCSHDSRLWRKVVRKDAGVLWRSKYVQIASWISVGYWRETGLHLLRWRWSRVSISMQWWHWGTVHGWNFDTCSRVGSKLWTSFRNSTSEEWAVLAATRNANDVISCEFSYGATCSSIMWMRYPEVSVLIVQHWTS